jgi:hypothetical protein
MKKKCIALYTELLLNPKFVGGSLENFKLSLKTMTRKQVDREHYILFATLNLLKPSTFHKFEGMTQIWSNARKL